MTSVVPHRSLFSEAQDWERRIMKVGLCGWKDGQPQPKVAVQVRLPAARSPDQPFSTAFAAVCALCLHCVAWQNDCVLWLHYIGDCKT
jgi:hypothetical protein